MVDRKSPTPPHNTREFQTWVDFAEAATLALADYPGGAEIDAVCIELETHRKIFAEWTANAASRPAPTERLPRMSAFMAARGRALDLLKDLAKVHPEIAAAAAARHREAYERSRK